MYLKKNVYQKKTTREKQIGSIIFRYFKCYQKYSLNLYINFSVLKNKYKIKIYTG